MKDFDRFYDDDDWQRAMRDRVLINGFYMRYCDERKFIPNDAKTECARLMQQRLAIDMTIQKDGHRYEVEEKIVRDPGFHYPTFFLETHHQNAAEGQPDKGWMRYGRSDILLYGMAKADVIDVYVIPFQPLRRWFSDREDTFKEYTIDNKKRTTGRLVPIDTVVREMDMKRMPLDPKEAALVDPRDTDVWTVRPNLSDPDVKVLFPTAKVKEPSW